MNNLILLFVLSFSTPNTNLREIDVDLVEKNYTDFVTQYRFYKTKDTKNKHGIVDTEVLYMDYCFEENSRREGNIIYVYGKYFIYKVKFKQIYYTITENDITPGITYNRTFITDRVIP